MRMLIDALSARQGGGQTYLVNLLANLPDIGEARIFVLAPPSLELAPHDARIERLPTSWPLTNPLLRAIWQRLVLPRILRRLEIDVLFVPGGVVATRPPAATRVVTMFRNMIPFDLRQRARYPLFGWQRLRNWILERVMLRSMTDADLVIFISAFAKSVIERRMPGGIRRSEVIPHGISDIFRNDPAPPLPRPSWLPAGSYLLYVSTIDYYKAQVEVVQAMAELKRIAGRGEKVVFAGAENPDYGARLRAEIARLGLQDSVILAGWVPYHELPAAYRHATAIVFASESENCPNILLESLAAGRPVLSSSIDPMPEFGGDAVIYFDPRTPADLAAKLATLLANPEQQHDYAQRATARSQCYDWRVTTHRTWHALCALHETTRPQ